VERRTQPRTNLRLPVFLISPDRAIPVHTQTEDLSMEGFFCYTQELFAPGQRLRFLLLLPTARKDAQSRAMYLLGTAEVTRVSAGSSGTDFGVGCRLSEYRVLTSLDALNEESIVAALVDPPRAVM